MERKTLLLLAILAGANAGPLHKERVFEDDRKCSSVCPETSKFNYQRGTTYEFNYDSSTITALTGASEEVSGLHITATADVEVLDRCEFALKLRDVRLEEVDPRNPERMLGAPGSTDFRRMLESETLRFSFQDGKVADLCPTEDERWQALNIKRGVLSAFQNSMEKLTEDMKTTESDVAGNCESEYKVKSNAWGQIKISKEKNILGCTDRHGKVSAFQAMQYRVPSTIQSMPLMKSHHNCEHTYHTDGRLIETSCEESHTFRPFSYGKSGATTTAKQTLKYKTYRSGVSTRQSSVGRRTDLLFEHAFEGERMERDLDDAVSQLREICRVADDDVRPEVPRLFANLVYKLRRLDTGSLSQVWNKVSNKAFCRKSEMVKKYFLDAIPACGTVASVSFIQKKINGEDVSGPMAAMWLNSLAFISRPSKQMLVEVKPLVDMAKPSRQAMLTVSALVNGYCRMNAECADDREVTDLITLFENNLGEYDCKVANKDQRNKVLMSLKALGNTGRAPKATEKLDRCAGNKELDTDIRVAAIQAFRRLPCTFDKRKLMSMFQDSEEDTEIRAHAYLAIMRCADKYVIGDIKTVLETEKSNQIGTFVWTHLTNLMETSDPFKAEIREILEDEELSKDFNNDLRKFSRNYEKSFFSQILNTGAKVESNVLFSQKSYIPRSMNLNLTLDMFGESLNLLELEGRVEGFEYMVESFFGPHGYFQQNDVNDLLNRKKRNVINYNDVNKKHNRFGARMADVTKGSGSVKIFGNEIAFGEFLGFDPVSKDSFNPLDMLMKLAKDQEIDYTKSAMIVDTSMIIPTMIGLPLNLTVNGTASVNIKIGGKVDIRKLMTSPHDFDIDGHIKPSGAVEISSVMTVDAFVARAGVKMVTTLHSSTYLDGKLTMKDGEFNFNLNTPKDKMEIFDAESKFFVIHKEEDREQRMITDNRVEKKQCTGQFLQTVLGIQLCGELQFPNAFSKSGAPFYPLTGPSKFSVILNKPDSMKGYEFQAKYKYDKVLKDGEVQGKYLTRLAFNTPGSRINRKITVDYQVNMADMSSSIELESPWKKVTVNGAVVRRPDLDRATLRMMIDEESEYALTTELQTETKGKVAIYKPNVELRIPRREPITLSGSMEFQAKRRYAVDLTLNKMFRHPVAIKSEVDTKLSAAQTMVLGSVEVRSQLIDSKVSLNFNMKPGKTMATRVELEYNLEGKPKQSFLLSKKIRNLKAGSYSMSTMSTSDAYADYNHQLDMNLNFNKKHVDFDIDVTYGDDFKSKDKNIFLKHESNFITAFPMKLTSKSKLKFPGQDVLANYDLTYNLKTALDHSMSVNGRWNNHRLGSNFNLKDESSRRLMKYTANGRLEAGKLSVSFDEKFEQTAPVAFTHALTVGAQGKSYEMTSTYSAEGKKHTASTDLKIPRYNDISVSGSTTLDFDDFAVSGDAKFGGKSYSTEGSFKNNNREKIVAANANIAGDQYSTENKLTQLRDGYTASSEVILKGRKYTTEATYNGQRDEHTVSGAVNCNGRRYSTEGKLVKQPEGWTASSKVVLPRKTYAVEGAYTFNTRLVTGTGSVDLNGDKYTAQGRLVNQDQTKSVLVSANLKGQDFSGEAKFVNNGREITGELDLASPWRRVESDMNLSGSVPKNMRGQMTVSWDAGRDDSRKMTVSGSYNDNTDRSAYKHVANLRVSHPEHVANLALNFDSSAKSSVSAQWNRHNIKGEGEFKLRKYSSGMLLSGDFGLTSSINYLEDLSLEFKHRCRGTSYTSGGSLGWAKNKKIGGDFELEYPSITNIKSKLTINTPFHRLNAVTVAWNHKLEGKTIEANAQGSADTQKFEITFSGTDKSVPRRPSVEGSINIKTPFSGYEDITSTLTHMHHSRMIDSKVETTLAPGKVITLTINGQDRSRNGRDVRGSINLNSPWRKMSASLQHTDDAATMLNSAVSAEWDAGKKIDVTVDLKNKGTGSRDLEGSVVVKTPFYGYNEMSLTAGHKDDLRQFDSSISATLQRRELLGAKFNMRHYARNWRLNNNGDLQISGSLMPLRRATFEWKHRSTESNINTEMNMKWPGKEISLNIDGDHKLDSRRSITTNIVLKTPFDALSDVAFTLSHENGDRDFKLSSSAKLVDELIKLDAELQNTNKKDLTATFKLLTPFMEDISSSVNVATSASPMTARADFTWSPRKTVGVDGSLTLRNGFNGDLRLTTPFRKFERFMLTARHEDKDDGMYKSGATFEYAPRKKFDLSSEINTNGKVAVNLDFKIPCPEVRTVLFNLEHTGDLSAFTNKMDFESQPSLGKFSTDVSLRTGRNFEAKATVTTPFRGYEEYSTSVTHQDRRGRMITNANVNWPYRQTVQLNSDLTLKALTEFSGSISLSTPFTNLEMTKLNFNHKGDLSSLDSHVDTEYMGGQKMSADVTFNSVSEITGTATVNTPFRNWERTTVTFNHKGEMLNFETKANAMYGRNQKIETSVSLDAESSRKIAANFMLKTPFNYAEDISLSYNHNGDFSRRFKCEYEIGYATGKKIQLTHAVDIRSDIGVDVTFKSPFEKFEDITASFKHAGPATNFKTTAEVNYAPARKVAGEVTFNMEDNVEGAVKLSSPFRYYEDVQASFRHSGEMRKFNSHAEVMYAPRSKIEGDVSFDMTRDIMGSVNVKTPFANVEDVSASFTHKGRATNFNSHAEVMYAPRSKIEGDVTFDMTRDIKGSVNVKTPFTNFEDVSASFTHKGRATNFETHAETTYAPSKKVEADVSFNMEKDIEAAVTFKSPFNNFKNIMTSFKHSGELTNFNTHAECTYAPRTKVEGDLSFSMGKEITGAAGFKSPFKNFEDISAGFTHSGNLKSFRTKANVQYSPRDKVDMDMNFKNNRRVLTGEIQVRTPFDMYRRQSASFRVRDDKVEADVVYNRNQKIDVTVNYPQWTDITATVKTPYRSFEEVGAVFKMTGDYNKDVHTEVTYMTGKKVEADAKYYYGVGRNNYRLDSSLVVKTPFRGYEEVGAKATYNGYPLKFVAHMDVYCPGRKYELDAENNLAEELNKKTIVTIKTPHENFEELFFNTRVQGIATNFNKHTEIQYYRGMKFIQDITFKNEGSIEGTYRHQTPYTDDFTANFKYNGEPKDFTSHMDFSYKSGETIESDIAFSIRRAISATASLKTPFRNFEDMSLNVVHKGYSWRSFSTSVVAKYSPRDAISASTAFTLGDRRLLANVQFSSPFRNFEQLKAEVTHDGDLSSFKSNAEVSYARGKKIEASAVVKNMEGTFTLNTPFTNFEELQMILKNRMNGDEYQPSGIFTWARGKSVNIDSAFKNTGEFFRRKDAKFHVSVTNTHRRDLSLSWKLDHSHMWKRSVLTRAVVNVNGYDYTDVTVNYRNARNEHRGSIELAKPLPMKVEASGSVDGGKVSAEAAVNWNTAARDSNVRLTLDTNNQGSGSMMKRDTMVKVITAYRTVIVEHNIELSDNKINNNIVYCWDDARDKKIAHELSLSRSANSLSMTNKLVSPWRSVKVFTSGRVTDRKSNVELTFFWDADRDNSKKVTLKGNHERFGNVMKQEVIIQHPNLKPDITIQNEVNVGDANTIYSTNTEIDYSGDKRKKLTVSTNLSKNKIRFRGTNYTMQVDITHPASSLDISIVSQLGNSERFSSAGIGMDYTSAKTRSKKSFVLRTEINKIRNEVEMQLLSPTFNLVNWGKMRDMSNKKFANIHLEMKNTYNGKTVLTTMDMDEKAKLLDLKVNYDPTNPLNVLHAYAKFNNDSAVTAEVYRMTNNKKITEGLFTARLNNSRLFHSRVHWRPSLVFDIKDGIYAVKDQLHPEGTMWADMAEEADYRYRRTSQMAKSEADAIIKKLNLRDERLALDNDMNMFTGEMANMLRRNEFYTLDMVNMAVEISDKAGEKMEEMKTAISDMAAATHQRVQHCLADMDAKWVAYQQQVAATYGKIVAQGEAKYDELKQQAEQAIEELKEQSAILLEQAVVEVSQAMEPYMIRYLEYYNVASEKMGEYMNVASAKYAEVMAKVYASSQYIRAMEKLDVVLEKLDTLVNHDFTQYIPEMPTLPEMPTVDYEAYYNQAQDFVAAKADQYTGAIYGAHAQMKTQITDFVQRAEIQALKNYANIAVEHGKWAYENYEIERHAKDIAKGISRDVAEFVQDNARYIAKEYLRLDDTRFTVWDPKQGEIQVEVGLPVAWNSFVEMPQYDQLVRDMQMLRKKLHLPKFNMSNVDQNMIMDYFYAYKPSRDYLNWIPPFKAHATIAGQHITTFDHRHYEFKGTCNYILAHDFIDGNFTVLLRNDKRRVKSLVVLSDDKEVQLLPGFTVRLNGKRVEMPIQFHNTTIMRIGNAIRVHNTNGVTITCDHVHDICTTNMTGWYFGKTAGLFGTYDNEPANDFMTLGKSQADNTFDFTDSWSTSCDRGLKHKNKANFNFKPDRNSATHRSCAALFEDDKSVLRPCFKMVDPSKYYDMCYNDLEASRKNSDDEALACNVAANYMQECAHYDIYLRLPRACVKCETGDNKKPEVIEGEEFTISKDAIAPPKSADVVFVLEQKSCNMKTHKSRSIEKLTKIMENILRKKGMKNNMYGLVGFGGEGVHDYEHSHTMDGKLFNTASLFKLGLTTLEFGDGANNDVLRAVRMASMYPFRAGVAKTIVVIPCSACDEAAVKYNEIQQLLFDKSIQMHVVREFDISRGKKNTFNFGLDTTKVYTNKDHKKLKGDTSLRKTIDVPKDLCVALAHETNGSLFNLNVITKKGGGVAKKLLTVFARRVVETLSPDQCQVCQCVADELGVGKSICHNCERPSFTDYFSKIMRATIEKTVAGKPEKPVKPVKPRKVSVESLKKKARKARN